MVTVETQQQQQQAEVECLPSDVNWTELLTKSRKIRQDCEVNEGSSMEGFFAQARAHFPHLRDLLQEYCDLLDGACDVVPCEGKKKLILDTRAALRVALSCSSFEDTNWRNRMVNEAVVHSAWHDPLVYLLSHKKGDTKCRVLASRLLSNLVTSHYNAAKTVTSNLTLSPSQDTVTARMREGLDGGEAAVSTVEPNWTDMMLACAHSSNRQALTGIVAALHNTIVSLDNPESNPNNQHVTFAANLASNSMLVSTLLRQMISMQSVQHAIEEMKHVDDTNKASESEEEGLADATTEWICLVLMKCCKLGLLPNLIASAGGVSGRDQLVLPPWRVVPEHVVLLQCLRSGIEAPPLGKKADNLLGGEVGDPGIVATHLFLASLYSALRRDLPIESLLSAPEGQGDPEIALKCSAFVTILELLSSSLGLDGNALSLTREKLGESGCTLIQDAGRDLGTLVDSVSLRNAGRKGREFYMSEEEKSVVSALVQLVGNVCYQCRQNQDLVRSTSVPASIHNIAPSDGRPTEERNALHVVLSCTSLAHTCFTLREWAVIAIRNLLDNNELNQEVVAKLEANQPVQSAELGDLGIKVNLDSKGKVSVLPTDAKP